MRLAQFFCTSTSQDLSVSFHLSALMTTSRSHRAASTIHSTGRAEFLLLGTSRDLGKIVLCNSYSSIQLAFTSTVFCYKGPKILKGFHLFYFIPIYEKISLFLENTILFFFTFMKSPYLSLSVLTVSKIYWSSVSFSGSRTVSSAYRMLFMVCPPIFIPGLWSMFLNIISV